MSGKEIRRRNVPHAWWDKKVFRFLSDNFSGKECIYITHIYMILCQIDSDFSEREEKPDKGIRGIVQTCATYAKMEKRTPALTISPVTFYAYPASCAIAGKYKGTKKTSKGILHSALAFMHLAFRAWRRKKVRHPLGGHLSMNRELCP